MNGVLKPVSPLPPSGEGGDVLDSSGCALTGPGCAFEGCRDQATQYGVGLYEGRGEIAT